LTPFYRADCPVAIVYRASWPEERVIRGTLATIEALAAQSPMERTALILVGPALGAEDFRESALYDATMTGAFARAAAERPFEARPALSSRRCGRARARPRSRWGSCER